MRSIEAAWRTITAGIFPALLLVVLVMPVGAQGLTGQYFNDPSTGESFNTNPVLTRIDPVIDFQWGTGSPDPAVHTDYFSVRWTGQLVPRYSDHYEFHLSSDDRGRLWIDGKLIIDNWSPHALQDFLGSAELTAGKSYDIKIEYAEVQYGAQVKLEWYTGRQAREVIPSSQLHPYRSDSPGIQISTPARQPDPAPLPIYNESGAVYRINAGGAAMATYESDALYSDGTAVSVSNNPIDLSGVSSPAPMAVYDTERYGKNFSYRLPKLVPRGNYDVRMHFAECWMDSAGRRVFNVLINGKQALRDFDIYAAVGKNRAVVREFFTTANGNGEIVISFMSLVDNAQICAIEVLPN
jgi:hypothetical protein